MKNGEKRWEMLYGRERETRGDASRLLANKKRTVWLRYGHGYGIKIKRSTVLKTGMRYLSYKSTPHINNSLTVIEVKV